MVFYQRNLNFIFLFWWTKDFALFFNMTLKKNKRSFHREAKKFLWSYLYYKMVLKLLENCFSTSSTVLYR